MQSQPVIIPEGKCAYRRDDSAIVVKYIPEAE